MFYIKIAQFYTWYIQNFLTILKIAKMFIEFSQKWLDYFLNFSKIFKTDQIVFNVRNNYLFDSFSNVPFYFIKIFYFYFLKITTKFSQKQERFYLKGAPVLLIKQTSWKFFQQFLKYPWTFSWNILKFFRKPPLACIFINCTKISKFVKIAFNINLNFIKLSNISKIF